MRRIGGLRWIIAVRPVCAEARGPLRHLRLPPAPGEDRELVLDQPAAGRRVVLGPERLLVGRDRLLGRARRRERARATDERRHGAGLGAQRFVERRRCGARVTGGQEEPRVGGESRIAASASLGPRAKAGDHRPPLLLARDPDEPARDGVVVRLLAQGALRTLQQRAPVLAVHLPVRERPLARRDENNGREQHPTAHVERLAPARGRLASGARPKNRSPQK